MQRLILFFCVLLFHCLGFCQNDDSKSKVPNIFLELNVNSGNIIRYSEGLKEQVKSTSCYGYEIKIGRQTSENNGYSKYADVLKYPSFGVGLFLANFDNVVLDLNGKKGELGDPTALFFFFDFPLLRTKHTNLGISAKSGLGFGFDAYDSITNPGNDLIGTPTNIFIDIGLRYKIELNIPIDFAICADFRHFSNASYKKPNIGINFYTLGFSAIYKFYDYKNTSYNHTFDKKDFDKTNTLYTVIGYGEAQIREDVNVGNDIVRNNLSLTLGYTRRPSYASGFGGGLDICYFEYGNSVKKYYNPDSKDKFSNDLALGLFIAGEINFDKLTFFANFW